jgi:hypothetical protein
MLQSLSTDRAVGLGVVAVVGLTVISAGLYTISHKNSVKEEKKSNDKKDTEKSVDVQDASELALAEHFGSCHCRNVRFKVRAPRVINAVDTSSKIKFPRFTMRCSDFALLCDDRALSMYTVKYGDGFVGIHSFCSFCGVQVLYSPTIEPIEIQVNVDCLDRRNISKIHCTRHCTGETERVAHNHELSHMFNRRGYGASEQQQQLQFSPLSSSLHVGHHLFPRDETASERHRPTAPSFYSESLLREASDPVYAGYMSHNSSDLLSTGGLSDVDECSFGHHSSELLIVKLPPRANSLVILDHYDAHHGKASFDEQPSAHNDRRSYSYEERLSTGSGAYSSLSSATVSPVNMTASGSTSHSGNSHQSNTYGTPSRYIVQQQQYKQQAREPYAPLSLPTQTTYNHTEYNAADDLTDHSHSSESSANYRRGIPSHAAVVAEAVRLSEPATPHLLRQLKKHLTKYEEAGGAHMHSVV